MAAKVTAVICTGITLFGLTAAFSLFSDFGGSLYTADDKITILNVSNFKSSIFDSNKAWLVEFYSSWCGHCINFAPTFKNFSASVYGWRRIIEVAGVDCALDENNPLCREYEVMQYPTLKFFHSHTQAGDLGSSRAGSKTEVALRHDVINFLEKEEIEGRGKGWPVLSPFSGSSADKIWSAVSSTVNFIAVVFEKPSSYVGREIVLDLDVAENVAAMRVLPENTVLAESLGVKQVPSLILLNRKTPEDVIRVNPPEHTRQGYLEALLKELQEFAGQAVNISVSNGESVEPTPDYTDYKNATKPVINAKMDVVYLVDLESTVHYALLHEVALHKVITGEALGALQSFLRVLSNYFPARPPMLKFLRDLNDWVAMRGDAIRGETYKDLVTQLEGQIKPFTAGPSPWIGCLGSEPHYRGYPCGLWTLFHTLTVNAVDLHGRDDNFNSLEVLSSILGYVKSFFSCAECSKHFQSMASESMFREVTKPDDAILWLWKAHNKVNKRLARDATEDPKHPKVQFPNQTTCSSCHSSWEEWNTEEVLCFLKSMYGRENVSYEGIAAAGTAAQEQEKVVLATNSGKSVFTVWGVGLLYALSTFGVATIFK